MYKRHIYQRVIKRMQESRSFLQVLLGPRQVGKTTLALQIAEKLNIPSHYATTDSATLKDTLWIEQQWELARALAKSSKEALLILDEVQKIPLWSDIIKQCWDQDTKNKINLKVVLLGSSPWLVQKGLTESLAGRFEIIPVTHWNFSEMQEAFNFSLDQFLYFGGYPGAAPLITDLQRWFNYINDSLIETTISRDILLITQINKPILLRRLFNLVCHYSGQILSYQKMVGQLQDVGNTTTLASYLELLNGVSMAAGLQKFSKKKIRQRASSPKLQVYNTALMSAQIGKTPEEAKSDSAYWGRLVESAVGAHLLNSIRSTNLTLSYWRERNHEVDFILSQSNKHVAIEVKSGRSQITQSGIEVFNNQYKPIRTIVIGKQGVALQDFLLQPALAWFE